MLLDLRLELRKTVYAARQIGKDLLALFFYLLGFAQPRRGDAAAKTVRLLSGNFHVVLDLRLELRIAVHAARQIEKDLLALFFHCLGFTQPRHECFVRSRHRRTPVRFN